jgi:3D (Asp-Asp-Asp) domain-containing protein
MVQLAHDVCNLAGMQEHATPAGHLHCIHIDEITPPTVRHAVILISAMMLAACSNEQQLTVTATAFNSTRAQTDSRPNETACGDKLRPDSRVIAVSRDLKAQGMVCGTEVEISGLDGTWTVSDVTARRYKQRIDIYMGRDIKAARQWGVQEVEITWRPDDRSESRVRLAESKRR